MIESETDALVDALKLSDVDADTLADSLGVIEAAAAAIPTAGRLAEVDSLAVVEPLEAVESLVVADPLVAAEALAVVESLGVVESLVVVDALGVVESLGAVDSDAADSLVVSDAADSLVVSDAADSLVVSDVDSVADALSAPVLPGAKAVLPSVARVLRFAAVTSYETGVRSDMS